MERVVLTIAALAAFTLPATAGQGLMCFGDGVETHFPLAGGVGFNLLGAVIDIGGKVYGGGPGVENGIEIAVAQAFAGDDRIAIDFTDANYEQVVAELRLFSAADEDDPVLGGTLRVAGEGVWAVSCSFG